MAFLTKDKNLPTSLKVLVTSNGLAGFFTAHIQSSRLSLSHRATMAILN